MAEYNPIELNSLPELTKLLSSDQIILFDENDNGSLSPNVFSVADLSSVAVLSQDTEDIYDAVNQVEELIKNSIAYLEKTFITKTDAESTYSTTTDADNTIGKFEKTVDFKDRVVDKADIDFLEYVCNKIRANCNSIKYGLGTGTWDGGGGRGYKRWLVAKAGVPHEYPVFKVKEEKD